MSPEQDDSRIARPITIGASEFDLQILKIQAKIYDLDFKGAFELAENLSHQGGQNLFIEACTKTYAYEKRGITEKSPESRKIVLGLNEFCVSKNILIDSTDLKDLLGIYLRPRLLSALHSDPESALQIAEGHNSTTLLRSILEDLYQESYINVVTEASPEIAASNLHKMGTTMYWQSQFFPDNFKKFLMEEAIDRKGYGMLARFPEVFEAIFKTWEKVSSSLSERYDEKTKRACDVFIEAVELMYNSAIFEPVKTQIVRSLGISFVDKCINSATEEEKSEIKQVLPPFIELHSDLEVVKDIPEHLSPKKWVG